jgi:glycosyltransferase involved in cell wall biosynthesis
VYWAGSDNLSEKRNQGINLAKYEVVLFLDSDCTVAPNLLQQHYDAYEDTSITGCLGPLEFVGHDTFIWQAVDRTSVLSCFVLPKFQTTASWGPTANISFLRKALLQVGGFDLDFSRPGGEDVDLGLRLEKAGGTIVCNPQALAYHSKDTWASFSQVFRRFLAYGEADVLLIRKHPARTTWDLPTPTHLLMMIFVFSALGAVMAQEAALLILPALWAGMTLMMYAWLSLVRERRPKSVRELSLQATALILFVGLDLGRIAGAFRRGELRGLYRRVIFFEDQQIVDWPDVATSALASFGALLLTLLIAALVLAW